MTIKFKTYADAKANFAKVSQDVEASAEEKTEALNEMMEALQKETEASVLKQARDVFSDNSIMQSRGHNVLTSEERKFFNQVIEQGGFTDEDILPKTTQERVFEDLVESHPLLQQLGIQNLGAVTEFIYSDPEGAAVWGPLFGDIQGQLNATFRKESITQLKLTAFIPVSNDMLGLGPAWIERYVRTMLTEAMSTGLERGFVAGDGNNMPIGLLYEKQENGAVVEKTPAGTLTFEPGRTTINELKGVVQTLSTRIRNGEEKIRNVDGRVVMVTNPFDSFGVKANSTIQNQTGAYVSSLPFNPTHVESSFVPQGRVVFFVRGEYLAAVGGALQLKKYDQTLAMEDATLYIAKQYATGKPVDNNAVQVYDLNLDGEEEIPAG